MSLDPGVRVTRARISVDAGLEHEHCVTALLSTARSTDDRRIAHAGDSIERALDVLREDVQTFGSHDHFLLPPADEHLAVGRDLANVTRVEPAALEGTRRLVGRIEVAGRHVFAAHQDFSVWCELDHDAANRLPDRALPGIE